MQALDAIEVDGASYEVEFHSFQQPLKVRLRGGGDVSLRPWTLSAHLGALGRHVRPGPSGLALDAQGFCGEVLAASGLGERAEELGPLALWWAAGGSEPWARPGPDGWLELGERRAQLRPWTHGERLRAFGDSVGLQGDGRATFDVEAYLRAMLRASIQSWAPGPCELDELDAAATAALLDGVVALNVPDRLLENEMLGQLRLGAQEMAATTLRLCRALGWTPSKVWATPAVEIDRLVALLDAAEGGPKGVAPSSVGLGIAASPRLADHPDAVVIRIEDDPA